MRFPRTPLDAGSRERLIAHYHEKAAKLDITPERALYDSARTTGNSAEDLDELFWMPPGSAAAWVTAQGLPPLDGVPVAKTAPETSEAAKPTMPTRR